MNIRCILHKSATCSTMPPPAAQDFPKGLLVSGSHLKQCEPDILPIPPFHSDVMTRVRSRFPKDGCPHKCEPNPTHVVTRVLSRSPKVV